MFEKDLPYSHSRQNDAFYPFASLRLCLPRNFGKWCWGTRPVCFLFFLICWLSIFASFCFAEKPQMWQGHDEGDTSLFASGAEGHELDRMIYEERQRTESGLAERPSNLMIAQVKDPKETAEESEPWEDEIGEIDSIYDPLEPMNRAFFQFNDKLYFWVLKPVATGYSAVVPQVMRVSIRNFFSNLVMPLRAVSCLLQGKFEALGIVLVRFVVNTSAGFLGFSGRGKAGPEFPGTG